MPKYQAEDRSPVDLALDALAHPVRRAIVERLARGHASMSELAEQSGLALPTQLQHLRVLERAGLVTSTKAGRVRTYRLRDEGLQVAGDWLAHQRRTWERRLDQLDEVLLRLGEAQRAGQSTTRRDPTHGDPTTHPDPTPHRITTPHPPKKEPSP